MKKISLAVGILSFFAFVQSATAVNCGPYVGIGAGYGILGTPDKNLFDVSNRGFSRGGLSGRAFIGYNIAQFFGIEGGYARYARSRYTGTLGIATSSIRYYERTADAVAKFYIPLACNRFSIYALAGAVSVWEQIKFADAGVPTVDNYVAPNPDTTNQRRTRPIYGVGVSVSVLRHLAINAEYTYIQQIGSFNKTPLAVPNAQLATIDVIVGFA
ncbi:MAG: outer membrane beta-barrel protein [Gammaproteobacteria bacterium]